ncbi:hypothetical protein QUA56_35050 [Microcoleus sp. N3A4]|uniref:hypothetical protein n=1 Tax=Microcoleus sp. N3A4 TaxID=3055379 RepID=UPI002FD2D776
MGENPNLAAAIDSHPHRAIESIPTIDPIGQLIRSGNLSDRAIYPIGQFIRSGDLSDRAIDPIGQFIRSGDLCDRAIYAIGQFIRSGNLSDRAIYAIGRFIRSGNLSDRAIYPIGQFIRSGDLCDRAIYINSGSIGINIIHSQETAVPISVNLTSNPITDCCLTIKSRSPLAPLNKQGGLIVILEIGT